MLRLPAKCESPTPASTAQRALPPAQPPQPRPILCLPAGPRVLYGELIQSSPLSPQGEPMVWVRPLLLSGDPVVDLRLTADLLWPARAFSPAYAEDLLPLQDQAVILPTARQLLHQFMTQVWQEHRQNAPQTSPSTPVSGAAEDQTCLS